jgi:hypothetical protein
VPDLPPQTAASVRTPQEIRDTGAAWVVETELEWLCDRAQDYERIKLERDDFEQRLHAYQRGEL